MDLFQSGNFVIADDAGDAFIFSKKTGTYTRTSEGYTIKDGYENEIFIAIADIPLWNTTEGGLTKYSEATLQTFLRTNLSVCCASAGVLSQKSGVADGASFVVGPPRKSTVTFTTPFDNTNYSVFATGTADNRTWTIESKTASGFVINSNAGAPVIGDVYWFAVKYGETL